MPTVREFRRMKFNELHNFISENMARVYEKMWLITTPTKDLLEKEPPKRLRFRRYDKLPETQEVQK